MNTRKLSALPSPKGLPAARGFGRRGYAQAEAWPDEGLDQGFAQTFCDEKEKLGEGKISICLRPNQSIIIIFICERNLHRKSYA